jgi:serine/threonine protein phosphatase 1
MVTHSLAPAVLPAGRRIYAIGDVHGCADRLAAMHALIAADLRDRPVARATVVHLGDLIDRGPDSAGVIALLLAPWSATPAPRVVSLMGNHEDMMLAALASADRPTMEQWMVNGGAESLRSWGVSHRTPPSDLWGAIPPVHLGCLRGLSLMHRAGGYVFVHAGLRPGVALERQARHDLLWIREPFLSHEAPLPAVVVHGHTPVEAPVIRANRLGIDTGAVIGGRLTCAVLEADTLGFMES